MVKPKIVSNHGEYISRGVKFLSRIDLADQKRQWEYAIKAKLILHLSVISLPNGFIGSAIDDRVYHT